MCNVSPAFGQKLYNVHILILFTIQHHSYHNHHHQIIPGSPLNFQGLRAEITFMGSSCAQSASQNHILLRQFTIYFNSTLNFKGLKILGTRRNDISVVFTMAGGASRVPFDEKNQREFRRKLVTTVDQSLTQISQSFFVICYLGREKFNIFSGDILISKGFYWVKQQLK